MATVAGCNNRRGFATRRLRRNLRQFMPLFTALLYGVG